MVEALLAGMVLVLGLAVVYLGMKVADMPSDEYHEGIEDQLRDLNERLAHMRVIQDGLLADGVSVARRLNDLDERIVRAEQVSTSIAACIPNEGKGMTIATGGSVKEVADRVNVLEAKVDALPDVASIITAATAPLVQVVSPPPLPAPVGEPASAPEDDPTAWDTYDPTDDEFPVRAADDYSPPPRMMGAMGLDV